MIVTSWTSRGGGISKKVALATFVVFFLSIFKTKPIISHPNAYLLGTSTLLFETRPEKII